MKAMPMFAVWLQLLCLLAAEVTLIVVGAALLQHRIRSAAWRRTLWQVCLLSLLVLTAFELTGSARGFAAWLVKRGRPQPRAEHTASRPAPRGETDEFRQRAAARVARNALLDNVGSAEVRPDAGHPQTVSPASTPALPVAHEARTSSQSAAAANDSLADPMAVLYCELVWLAGAGLVIARSCLACFLLLVFRWRRPAVTDDALNSRVAAMARTLGFGRGVQLVASARLAGPIAFGVIRPVIAVPADFMKRFSLVQQEAIFAHELAHLAGRDPVWYLLANWVSAILWWHPLVWWARRQLHCASEQIADEASLLVGGGPGALAECLVEIGARLGRQRSFVWMGVEGNGLHSDVGRRVERLVDLRGRPGALPGRLSSALARLLGPAAMVVAVILCTAWVGPRALTKGESMKTIKQTWSHSLAAFALLTSTPEVNHAALPVDNKRDGSTTDVAELVQDGRLLYQMGKFHEAESKLKAAARRDPGNADIFRLLTLVQEHTYAQTKNDTDRTKTSPLPGAEKPSDPARNSAGKEPAQSPSAERYQRLMMERYGIIPKSGTSPADKITIPKERSPIATKLERIVIDEVRFDGVPLPQVLEFLDEEARKRDPDRLGVNLLINPNAAMAAAGQTIDPTTGQALPAAPPEPLDMSSVIVRFNLPLRNMRLKDVLDAIVKVADKPIEYSVEEYGVVFSQSPQQSMGSVGLSAIKAPELPLLQVRTFKVDTNTFLAGMNRAFGIGWETKDSPTADQIRSTLRDVFVRLGIDMDVPGKTVFYNDLTGIVMVRATLDDLEIVEAAIETLGGFASEKASAQNSAGERAGLFNHREEMMRRYGIVPPKK